MTAPWTIARVLEWIRQDFAGRSIPSPRLEAELIIAHVLSLRRVELYTRFDQPLRDGELADIRKFVERRRKYEPLAYIVGTREFYGRSFHVDSQVLIPRPETEEVIEAALGFLPARSDDSTVTVAVLDLCVGSGAIAVTIALERPDARVEATDISPGAVVVAKQNAEKHGVADRVAIYEGSLYSAVGDRRYALVISNPPYIASAEILTLMPDVRDFEPKLALDGGSDGEAVLRPLVEAARAHLIDGGTLVVEIGADQGPRARALAERAGFGHVEVRKDLSGRERILIAR